MDENIFDAQRARRLAVERQRTATIRVNPDTAAFLRRYEDADVSRLKLLEAQRTNLRGQTELDKLQKKRLKKRLRGKSKKDKKQKKEKEVVEKSPLEVEIDVQERRDKLRREQQLIEQGDRRLQLEDMRQQREFYTAERDRQQRELQRQTDFISGQNLIAANQQIANYNAAQAALRTQASNDSRTAQAIANRQQQAEFEEARLQLQARELDANFEQNREERALRYAEIDADRARYDRDVRLADEQRQADIARTEREFADIRERVARDDAFRHAQLQEQQRLALEQLAQQQRDNTARHQLEQNRIDNQRAVDAERAITDRELIQTFQSQLDALNRRFESQPVGGALEVVERGSGLPASHPDVRHNAPQEEETPRIGGELNLQAASDSSLSSSSTEFSGDTETERVKQIQSTPGDVSPRATVRKRSPSPRRFERRGVDDPTKEGEATPGALRETPPKTQPFGDIAEEKQVGKALAGQKKQKPKVEGGYQLVDVGINPKTGRRKQKAFSRRDVQTSPSIAEPKPEPEPAPTVQFKVEELTKSQVERDLPFVGPQITGDLRQSETVETPITREPNFGELSGRIGSLTPQSTDEEFRQAEKDLELFGRTPNIGGD